MKRFSCLPVARQFACALSLALALPVVAEVADTRHYDIPAGDPLGRQLSRVATEAGLPLSFDPSLTQGLTSPALSGELAPREVLGRLLQGSGLMLVEKPDGSFTLARRDVSVLMPLEVSADAIGWDAMPGAYAGGQVARGGSVGILGQKDVMETPFSTISYTEQRLQDLQAQDIGAVIGATDPSVYVPSKRNLFETYFVRGFSSSADDMTFNGLVGMAPNLRGVTEVAERVELLKGPSALLNGMLPGGSVAGSVNIVPKRAGKEPLARITTSYESDSLWGGHVDLGQRFGDNQQWGVRFNGVYRDGDTPVDGQQHRMQLASLGLDWRGENARVSVDLYSQQEDMDRINYFGIFAVADGVTRVPTPKHGDYSLAPDWAYTSNESDTVVLRGEYDLTDTVTAYAAWGHKDGGYDALVDRSMLLNDAGDISTLAARSARDGTVKSAEVGVRGDLTTGWVRHAWSLSANQFESDSSFRDAYFFDHVQTNYYDLDFGVAPDLTDYNQSPADTSASGSKLRSIAIADTLSFADDRYQLTLGARRQNVQSDNYGADGASTAEYDASRTSPSAALLIRVSDALSLYANYIEGLSQGATAPVAAANAGEVLEPYQTKQYEIGAKWDLGAFAHTLSLFQIKKPNAYTDPDTLVFGTYGEQRNRGLEWSFVGEPLPRTRLLGGASYTEAEVTRSLNGANEGNQVTGVPKVLAKVGAEYDLARVPGLTLTAGVVHTGKRYVNNSHRLAVSDYTTFDVGARYVTRLLAKSLTLRARVQNVTNEAYWLGSWNGGDGSGLSGGLGAPRTFLMSATVDF